MIFKQEAFADCIGDMTKHVLENNDESGQFQDKMELELDLNQYQALEDLDLLKIFTLRKDEQLIGYNVFLFHPPLHHANSKWANNDVVYIDPAYRSTGYTVGFFQQCEDALRDMGAEVIVYHENVKTPFTRLLEELGMEHTENVYMKYIGQ